VSSEMEQKKIIFLER
jgi:hypothetical protein